MSTIFAVPDSGQESFVALSNSKRGRLFEKHILNYGELLYPKAKDGKVIIDDEFADKLIENFEKKYCPIVQVPLADDKNRHSEAPDRNIGQVVGLTKRDGKIYASIDVRKAEYVDEVGNTLLGASALFSTDYVDTKTLKSVGPTLLHVAVTNRPYVTDLEDYNEMIAASADSEDSELIVLTLADTDKEKDMKTLDEALAYLRDEHEIDVPALQKQASEAQGFLALSARMADALKENDLIALSNPADEVSPEDVLNAITAAGEKIVTLSAQVDTLETEKVKAKAEADVDDLVRRGFILKPNRDAMVELSMKDADLFKSLLPSQPLIELSLERGSDAEPNETEVALSEVERITKSYVAPATA